MRGLLGWNQSNGGWSLADKQASTWCCTTGQPALMQPLVPKWKGLWGHRLCLLFVLLVAAGCMHVKHKGLGACKPLYFCSCLDKAQASSPQSACSC